MDWQNLANLAEIISAVAALITVLLALVELASRSKAKKAAVAMDVYSEFLFVRQQVSAAVGAAKSFADHAGEITPIAREAFAQAHTVRREVFETLEKVTKEGIGSFDCFSEEGKQYSTVIMECTGVVQNFLHYINTYLATFSTGQNYDSAKVKAEYAKIEEMHCQVLAQMESANVILRDNLKTSNRHSTRYIVILLIILAVTLTICFLL